MDELSQCTVMVVDDNENNIDILVEALGDDFNISVAMDGESALEDIKANPPDLILLDVMMPGMSGYEVCRKLKADEATANLPVIFVTAINETSDETRGFALGAIDYIAKPISPPRVKARVRNHLELKLSKDRLVNQKDDLEDRVAERTRELSQTKDLIIQSLTNLAETRDPETGGHIKRTRNYVKILAEQLKHHDGFQGFFDEKTIDILYRSAPLHDIGKVGVPDHILLKAGKLTPEEFKEMARHTTYGRDALPGPDKHMGSNSFVTLAREIIYTHHEKWDGTGYPQGLKGKAIPIPGRLMALADVYDALISKRVYKPAFSHRKAVSIILEGKGSHFDPDVVDAFLEQEEAFRKTALEFADFDEEREALACT